MGCLFSLFVAPFYLMYHLMVFAFRATALILKALLYVVVLPFLIIGIMPARCTCWCHHHLW